MVKQANFDFTDTVAIVTGAASGMGAGIAEAFVAAGGRLVAADVDEKGLASLGERLGDACTPVPTDLRFEDQVVAAVEKTVSIYGHLDVAFNVAGLSRIADITEQTEDDWNLVFDSDLKGTMFIIKHASAQMIEQGNGGSIVNFSSVAAHAPAAACAAYCCSKAGVAMLTKVAALDLGVHDIRVNCIAPGLVRTPLTEGWWSIPGLVADFEKYTPIGRISAPPEIAKAALFLAGDEASFISGTDLFVDGGLVLRGHPDTREIVAQLAASQDQGKGDAIVAR